MNNGFNPTIIACLVIVGVMCLWMIGIFIHMEYKIWQLHRQWRKHGIQAEQQEKSEGWTRQTQDCSETTKSERQ